MSGRGKRRRGSRGRPRSRSGFVPVEGVRTAFRTTEDGWIVASLVVDDESLHEVARFRKDLFESPGDPRYHGLASAVSEAVNGSLERILGVEGIRSFRQAPKPFEEGGGA